ncbi:MAG: hypothetical protein LJE69_18185 [Thiohalocapsa sp.]|jgi:hypothetical protein|uniref:hypothetical protein n=1 Tax=Thiohalocapsa sp. TaxID=2497641 RepID=UPI0025D488F4|nr:hypothetical protein [Thiohalocapsa sp.]MCG6943165.1 hypothetical protein [Thiohalocapsa sp.]
MKLTRTTRLLLLILIVAAPIGAVAAAKPAPVGAPAGALNILVEPNSHLTPAGIQASRDNGALEVSGRIEKRYDRRGHIGGHVQVELLGADGGVLAQRAAPLIHFSPSRKNPDYATFLLQVDDAPAGVAAVRVSHRD